jgi:hypothetical protein
VVPDEQFRNPSAHQETQPPAALGNEEVHMGLPGREVRREIAALDREIDILLGRLGA